MIQQNAAVPQEQNQYTTKYDETSLKLKEAESRKNIVEQKIKSMQERRSAMEQFIKNIKRQNNIITEFSEELWCSLLDYVTAYSGGKLVFRFRNGSEIVA